MIDIKTIEGRVSFNEGIDQIIHCAELIKNSKQGCFDKDISTFEIATSIRLKSITSLVELLTRYINEEIDNEHNTVS